MLSGVYVVINELINELNSKKLFTISKKFDIMEETEWKKTLSKN